jgi:penicillin-binding protein 1A
VNGAAARLIQRVGLKKTQRYGARMMDIPRERLRPVVTLALGTSEVTPLEICNGYCTFATGGMRPKRLFVDKITDAGAQTLLENTPVTERVLEEKAGLTMVQMLRGVVSSGTGRGARALRSKGYDCGGKTGTTNSGRDAWWIGFTPDLVCAVWVGNDNNQPMRRAAGSRFCLPIWLEFMKEAMPVVKTWDGYVGKFPRGQGVPSTKSEPEPEPQATVLSLCADTHLIAGPYCPSRYTREYSPGERVETQHCTAHVRPVIESVERWAPPVEPPEPVGPAAPAGGGPSDAASPPGRVPAPPPHTGAAPPPEPLDLGPTTDVTPDLPPATGPPPPVEP